MLIMSFRIGFSSVSLLGSGMGATTASSVVKHGDTERFRHVGIGRPATGSGGAKLQRDGVIPMR